MTEKYNVGEHVKIVKSDSIFNDALGDQTGLVGTIMHVNGGGHPKVIFPHTGDETFFYLDCEVERAGKTTPAPEPVLTQQEKTLKAAGLSIGDKVKTYSDKLGTVTAHYRSGSSNIAVKSEYGNTGYYTPSQVEKYTEPYKPAFKTGDYAKIVITGYGESYRNIPFEVLKGDAEEDGYVELHLIPPSGDRSWVGTFTVDALEKAKKPKKPKPQFKVGDRVEFNQNYLVDVLEGDTGTVTAGNDRDNFVSVKMDKDDRTVDPYSYRLKLTTKPASEPKFKVGDWVQVKGYSAPGSTWEGFIGEVTRLVDFDDHTYVIDNHTGKGYSTGGFQEKYLVAAEKPYTPKFNVGDWVKVNYAGIWQDKVGQVTELPTYAGGYTKVAYPGSTTGRTGGFLDRELTLTTEPFKTDHKVGDWVKVTGWNSSCDGTVYQIKEVPADQYSYYRFENTPGVGFSDKHLEVATEPKPEPKPEPKFKAGDWVKVVGRNDHYDGIVGTIEDKSFGKFWNVKGTHNQYYQFADDKLEVTEAPHWTETKPVHTAARVEGRTIVKVEADKWLFIYHNGAYTEPIQTSTYRDNAETMNLFGKSVPVFTEVNT